MKKILVIGAGFLQSYVIKEAKRLGYYVIAVDGNPKAEGFIYADEFTVINITDEQACLSFAKEKNIDGVLTAATDYGVLTAALIAQELGLNGINYESAKVIKNKYLVRKKLSESSSDDTENCYELTKEEDIERVQAQLSYPVMVKPCDGSGSRGASRVSNQDEFKEACLGALDQSLTQKVLIEPFIFGEEYGVESFVYNNDIYVLGIMKKLMTRPPYYAELGHMIPAGLSLKLEQKIKMSVVKAIKALGINFGSVNMDMLLTVEGKVHIVDIGARMGGNLIGSHIIPLGTGIQYIENMIKAAVGDPVDFSERKEKQAVATRLLALQSGTIQALPDFNLLKNQGIIEHHLKVGDIINEYRTNLDGCGYVVCVGASIEECNQRAETLRTIIDEGIVRER